MVEHAFSRISVASCMRQLHLSLEFLVWARVQSSDDKSTLGLLYNPSSISPTRLSQLRRIVPFTPVPSLSKYVKATEGAHYREDAKVVKLAVDLKGHIACMRPRPSEV
jgi:hypothetical protein